MPLGIKRVEVALWPVLAVLANSEIFGKTVGVKKRFLLRLRANLIKSEYDRLEPIGFSLAMYHALDGFSKAELKSAKEMFPKVIEEIEKLEGDYPAFCKEVRKFSNQFQQHIRNRMMR